MQRLINHPLCHMGHGKSLGRVNDQQRVQGLNILHYHIESAKQEFCTICNRSAFADHRHHRFGAGLGFCYVFIFYNLYLLLL